MKTPEQIEQGRIASSAKRVARLKPDQPTLLRKTHARNLVYLESRGLARPFDRGMRVLKPRVTNEQAVNRRGELI